jgi:hypothetical protein
MNLFFLLYLDLIFGQRFITQWYMHTNIIHVTFLLKLSASVKISKLNFTGMFL